MKRLVLAFCLTGLMACADSTAPRVETVVWFKTTTTGGDIDADGYWITVDGTIVFPIGPSALFRLAGLDRGTHQLRIEDVAANCTLNGASERQFLVTDDHTPDLVIEVECDATGVRVTTNTTGVDVPFEGFAATVAGREEMLASTGVATMTRIAPGTHSITVEPTENCQVIGGKQRTVVVELRKVSPVAVEVTCSLTPKEIAFTSDNYNRGYYTSLSTGTMAGTHLFNLVKGAHSAAWSPDGRKLAYSNAYCDWYYGYPCTGGLYVIDADTGAEDPTFAALNGTQPAWSPDGRSLAYVTIRENFVTTLVLHRPGGITRVSFARPLASLSSPSWSHDGSRIVFGCAVPGRPTQICVMDAGSNDFTQLTDANGSGEPAWSPDGKTIAFVKTGAGNVREIFTMNPDGSDVKRLAAGSDPAWSPDGTRLIFGGPGGLYTVRLDGSELKQITAGSHREPSWRP